MFIRIHSQDLQYRDTIILCPVPRDNTPVVSRLRARGLPVQVVTWMMMKLPSVTWRCPRSDFPRDVMYIRAAFVILTVFVVTEL
nr:hypothetical protein BaRGS_004335 [Batillaria attramentaria]